MNYDFDTMIDRKASNSIKWEVKDGELPMTIADMDFKTAPEIIEAMHEKVDSGVFGYEYPTEEYFKAVQSWYAKEHASSAPTSWMTFMTGVIPAITASVNHFSQTGDKVLMLEPIYNTFYNSIINSGRQVLASQMTYDPDKLRYAVDWADLEEKMADPLTTMMILCNPHNPTGHVWSKEELEKILLLAQKHGVIVISDEIHGDLVLEGDDYTPVFSLDEKLIKNAITLVSPSKTFNLAGLHAATAIVSDPILRERFVRAVNKYDVAEPNLLAIPASITAYTKGNAWVHQLKDYVLKNRNYLADFLKKNLPQIKLASENSTYLVWVDVSSVTDDSAEFARQLREKTGLIVNPGTVYGGNGNKFIRISLACPLAQVKDAASRLQKFFTE
ncbi:MalY/PatB family protein [Lactobacillus sp.]|uniref:MalY/PatB family protein n=1 Tax=Lactobacillus sp. TaxID=1591 RepID=UPI003F07C590